MNAKHRETLEAIFSSPTSKGLPFRNIESLLKAVGCKVYEGEGSRILFTFCEIDWPTHRPHPQKEAKVYQVKEARDYLRTLGIEP